MSEQIPPAAAPVKSKHTVRNVVLVLVALAVVIVVARLAAATGEAGKSHTVVYKISGTSKVASLITYSTDGSTATAQFSNAAVPWEKSFEITGGVLYQVIVQNSATDSGTVECAIEVDGLVVTRQTGDGAATIAHCTYGAP